LDPRELLKLLEQVAATLGVIVRYEMLGDDADLSPARSGSCRLRRDRIIFVEDHLTAIEKCHVLADELKRYEISSVYVPPAVRRLLDDSENDY
jgi:hypothetical protein